MRLCCSAFLGGSVKTILMVLRSSRVILAISGHFVNSSMSAFWPFQVKIKKVSELKSFFFQFLTKTILSSIYVIYLPVKIFSFQMVKIMKLCFKMVKIIKYLAMFYARLFMGTSRMNSWFRWWTMMRLI